MKSNEITKLKPLSLKQIRECPRCHEQFKTVINDQCNHCDNCKEELDAEVLAYCTEWAILGDMDEKNR